MPSFFHRHGADMKLSFLPSYRIVLGASVLLFSSVLTVAEAQPQTPIGEAKLLAHWPFATDARCSAGPHHAAVQGGVSFTRIAGRLAADLNGRDGYLEIPHTPALAFGKGDFSLSLWINPRRPLAGIPGD